MGKGEIARYVFKRLNLQTHKNQGLFGKGLKICFSQNGENTGFFCCWFKYQLPWWRITWLQLIKKSDSVSGPDYDNYDIVYHDLVGVQVGGTLDKSHKGNWTWQIIIPFFKWQNCRLVQIQRVCRLIISIFSCWYSAFSSSGDNFHTWKHDIIL